jgi:hypothetical protein
MSIYELSLLRISHWSSVIGRGAFRYDHGGSGTGMWLAGRQPRATGKSEQIRAAPLAVLVALPRIFATDGVRFVLKRTRAIC